MDFNSETFDETTNANTGDEAANEEAYAGVDFEGYSVPEDEFVCLNSVVGDGIQKEKELGISTLAFDTHEELLWMGTKTGHVSAELRDVAVIIIIISSDR